MGLAFPPATEANVDHQTKQFMTRSIFDLGPPEMPLPSRNVESQWIKDLYVWGVNWWVYIQVAAHERSCLVGNFMIKASILEIIMCLLCLEQYRIAFLLPDLKYFPVIVFCYVFYFLTNCDLADFCLLVCEQSRREFLISCRDEPRLVFIHPQVLHFCLSLQSFSCLWLHLFMAHPFFLGSGENPKVAIV